MNPELRERPAEILRYRLSEERAEMNSWFGWIVFVVDFALGLVLGLIYGLIF